MVDSKDAATAFGPFVFDTHRPGSSQAGLDGVMLLYPIPVLVLLVGLEVDLNELDRIRGFVECVNDAHAASSTLAFEGAAGEFSCFEDGEARLAQALDVHDPGINIQLSAAG